MTTQELGDKLQNIAHSGKSLSRVYILNGNKYKEIKDVNVVQDGLTFIIKLEEEKIIN